MEVRTVQGCWLNGLTYEIQDSVCWSPSQTAVNDTKGN